MKRTNRTILSILLVCILLLSTLITPIGAGTISPKFILGDVDRSGAVDIVDAIQIIYREAGFQKYVVANFDGYTGGDIDGDGEIGILDATLIQRWLAQIDVPYGIGEQIQNKPVAEDGKIWLISGIVGNNTVDHNLEYLIIGAMPGTPVMAVESGVVTAASNSCSHYSSHCSCNGGYGNYVWIRTSSGIETIYSFLTLAEVNVGDVVKKGEIIGYVGASGYASGPSLHFECRQNGVRIDPYYFYEE